MTLHWLARRFKDRADGGSCLDWRVVIPAVRSTYICKHTAPPPLVRVAPSPVFTFSRMPRPLKGNSVVMFELYSAFSSSVPSRRA